MTLKGTFFCGNVTVSSCLYRLFFILLLAAGKSQNEDVLMAVYDVQHHVPADLLLSSKVEQSREHFYEKQAVSWCFLNRSYTESERSHHQWVFNDL